MYYLYGSMPGAPKKLVATFSTEEQLLAYVRWATLSQQGDVRRFEKGSALAGYREYDYSTMLQTSDDAASVVHNPSPSML